MARRRRAASASAGLADRSRRSARPRPRTAKILGSGGRLPDAAGRRAVPWPAGGLETGGGAVGERAYGAILRCAIILRV